MAAQAMKKIAHISLLQGLSLTPVEGARRVQSSRVLMTVSTAPYVKHVRVAHLKESKIRVIFEKATPRSWVG